jgi:hypothetical protein
MNFVLNVGGFFVIISKGLIVGMMVHEMISWLGCLFGVFPCISSSS